MATARKKYILCIFNRIYTQDSHRQYLFFHAEYPLKSVFAILSTHNTFHMNINTTSYDLLSLTFKHTRECELCDMHAKIHFRFWCILCLSGGIFILFLLDCMFVFVVSCLLMLQNIPEAHMLNILYSNTTYTAIELIYLTVEHLAKNSDIFFAHSTETMSKEWISNK